MCSCSENFSYRNSAYVCCESDVEEVVLKSLDVLDAIVRYSTISQPTMTIFISALSRAVCLEIYNAASWKVKISKRILR